MKLKDFFANGIVTFCGVGYIPIAPGTWASLVSALFLFQFWPTLSFEVKLISILVVFLAGWYFADYVEKRDHSHDPSMIVIDEVLGMMIASFFVESIWWHWALAFFLFRIFDILKFWPASYFDRRKGGFSILFDDVLMAVFALALTQTILSQF